MGMTYKNISSLKEYFKCDTNLELLENGEIRGLLKDIRFYLEGKEYILYYGAKMGAFWFMELTERGDWIRVKLTEHQFSKFQVSMQGYYTALGYEVPKEPEAVEPKPEVVEKESYVWLLGGVFTLATLAMTGMAAYRRYKA